MKKTNLITLLLTIISSLFIISGFAFASDDYWVTDTSSGDTYVTSGNVGIGTDSPNQKLDIIGSIRLRYNEATPSSAYLVLGVDGSGNIGSTIMHHTSDYLGLRAAHSGDLAMVILPSGNVGIGITSPSTKIHSDVGANSFSPVVATTTGDGLFLSSDGVTHGNGVFGAGISFSRVDTPARRASIAPVQLATDPDRVGLAFFTHPSSTASADMVEAMRIESSGNIGIGTRSPQSKLAVNGTITTKEVKVTATGWSDFVFEDNYKLPSLNQVESYIKKNKHLPDIPSAKQVEKEGLSMAEMMAKQMQKIEELTLYVIELKKENENQSMEIAALRNELAKKNN